MGHGMGNGQFHGLWLTHGWPLDRCNAEIPQTYTFHISAEKLWTILIYHSPPREFHKRMISFAEAMEFTGTNVLYITYCFTAHRLDIASRAFAVSRASNKTG